MDGIDARNFQKRSNTELWIPNRVLMVSALLAMSSKIGQIQIVRRATRITGARDVIADAALGWAFRKSCSGFMKPQY